MDHPKYRHIELAPLNSPTLCQIASGVANALVYQNNLSCVVVIMETPDGAVKVSTSATEMNTDLRAVRHTQRLISSAEKICEDYFIKHEKPEGSC